MVKRKQIELDSGIAAEVDGLASGGSSMVVSGDRDLVPPSSAVLQQALEAATGREELAHLRAMAATYLDVAQRLKLARDELVRLAIWRIDVERKLGAELARTVGRGGQGSKLHSGTSKRGGATNGLPDLINKASSKRYQDLAAIPEDVLQDYLSRVAGRGAVPSPGGARSFAVRLSRGAAPATAAVPRRRGKVLALPSPVLSAEVRDALLRFFGTIHVVIGDAALPCRQRCSEGAVDADRLRGAVLVVECREPAEQLPKLGAARLGGAIEHVVVALPVRTSERWFHEALANGWTVCFVANGDPAADALMLLYHGSRMAPWQLVFGEVGTVLRSAGPRG